MPWSNRALTGTRVPRNTQAPLCFSGLRSTASQVVQSSMEECYARCGGRVQQYSRVMRAHFGAHVSRKRYRLI